MEVGEVPDLGEQPHWLQTGPGIASVETVVDESDVPSQQNHSVETSSISSSELDALRLPHERIWTARVLRHLWTV